MVAEPPSEQYSSASEHYVWTFPGAPIRIRLDLAVVERLLREAATRAGSGQDVCGVLTGHSDSAIELTINGFKAISHSGGTSPGDGEDVERLRISMQAEANGLTVVGFYRHRSGEGLRLEKDDLLLMQNRFSDPSNVFLLFRSIPNSGTSAGFFFWENGFVESGFCFKEFPFDPDRLRIEEMERRLAELRTVSTSDAASENRATDAPEEGIHAVNQSPQPPSRWVLISTLAGAMLCGLTAGYLIWSGSATGQSEVSSALALRIYTQADDLRITWDRNAAALQDAHAKGLLTISDGDLPKREIKLEGDELRSTASIVYSPLSKNVQIRLAITGNANEIGETVIAMKGPPATNASPVQHSAAPITVVANKDIPPPREVPKRESKPFLFLSKGQQPVAESWRQVILEPPVLFGDVSSTVSIPSTLIEASKAPPLSGPPLPEKTPATNPTLTPARAQIPLVPDRIATTLEEKRIGTFISPKPTRRVLPSFPLQARASITRDGEVKVRVNIDAKGKVKDAAIVSSTFPLLVGDSILAARSWQFEPAKLDGKNIESETLLVFKVRARTSM